MDEALEMRRMLAWFKTQLPPHQLENWEIRAEPVLPAFAVEGKPWIQPTRGFRIKGGVSCERCGGYFSIPRIGNATAHSEDSIPATTEKMKEWVERKAGPCWGDVPKVVDPDGPVAVLDSVT